MDEMSEAKQLFAEQVRSLAAEHAAYPDEAITQEKRLGDFGFGEVLPTARETSALFIALNVPSFALVPERKLHRVTQLHSEWTTVVLTLQNFDAASSGGSRDNVLSNARDRFQAIGDELSNIVAVARATQIHDEVEQYDLPKLVSEAVAAAVPKAETITDLTTKATTALRTVEDAAKKTGVYAHAARFRALADWNAYRSYALLGCTFLFAVFLFYHNPINLTSLKEKASFIDLWKILLPQLGRPAFCLFGLLVCAKLFAAERHNLVVNRHREAALSTFEVFVAGAHTEATKDAILQQAAAAVFVHQPTGYTKAPIEVGAIPIGPLAATKSTTEA